MYLGKVVVPVQACGEPRAESVDRADSVQTLLQCPHQASGGEGREYYTYSDLTTHSRGRWHLRGQILYRTREIPGKTNLWYAGAGLRSQLPIRYSKTHHLCPSLINTDKWLKQESLVLEWSEPSLCSRERRDHARKCGLYPSHHWLVKSLRGSFVSWGFATLFVQ